MPGLGGGNRPGIGEGNRPGNRPGIGEGNRPGIGEGNRPGNRPGIGEGNRPGIGEGNRPGIGEGNRPGNRPGIGEGNRPGTLPGIGNGNIGNGNRPNIGNGNRPNIGNDINIGIGNGNDINIGNGNIGSGNIGNRPSQLPVRDRRNNLADRMRPGYGGRPGYGRPGYGRPGYGRPGNGWGNGWGNHYHHHNHWHHGPWHGGWNCGSRWNYWWNNYPVMTAFGVTTWAVNRVGWAFGYNSYTNPYYTTGSTVYVDNSVYDYSQPIVMAPEETTLGGDVSAEPAGIPPESLSNFDQARQEFYAGKYEESLKWTDAALKELPNDAVIHEFRALTLFALGKYPDAAVVLYAVLSVGPGWDWTTMSGLYPDVDTYTAQLRKLEAVVKSNPDDAAATLLLAYHYLTAGHDDAAEAQLTRLVRLTPDDPVAKQMLLNIDPDAEIPNPARQVEPPKPEVKVDGDKLEGSWTASRDGGKFTMDLKDDGTFSWKFSQGEQGQEVTGVWNVDEDGVLAMEMNDGGVMLSQLVPKTSSQLDFYMLGDTQGSDPLSFSKG